MSNAIDNIRQLIGNDAASAVDRAHVEVLYARYDELMTRVLGLEEAINDPDRTNKISLTAAVIVLAKDIDRQYPRRVKDRDELRHQELLDTALATLGNPPSDAGTPVRRHAP